MITKNKYKTQYQTTNLHITRNSPIQLHSLLKEVHKPMIKSLKILYS